MKINVEEQGQPALIDVNTSLGFWPIQPLPWETAEALDQALASEGVEQAWVAAIESILFPQPDTFDQRLSDQLCSFPRLKLVKTVNPLLANWRQGCEQLQPVAIKLYPAYHGYSMEDEWVDSVAEYAADRKLPLLIALRVNDERNQPVCMQVPAVAAETVAAFSQRHPNTVVIALCAYRTELSVLAAGSDHLLADTSFLDGVSVEPERLDSLSGDQDALQAILEQADTISQAETLLGEGRLVYGSHSPFLYPRVMTLKLAHSSLSSAKLDGVRAKNVLCRLG